MLQIVGNVYADTPDKLDVIVKAIEGSGLLIAYRNTTGGDIIQEIPDPEEPSEES